MVFNFNFIQNWNTNIYKQCLFSYSMKTNKQNKQIEISFKFIIENCKTIRDLIRLNQEVLK